MIIHIFYSLVLFPHMRYGEVFSGTKCRLERVIATDFGAFEVSFIDENNTKKSVFFVHKDFFFEQSNNVSQTKNWYFYSEDVSLQNEIYVLLKQTDIHDFHFFKDADFYDARPFGTVLTITSQCNLFCNYCFNDYDYPLKDRNTRKNMGLEQYKDIVDKLYAAGTRDIIITGGEPFSAPFLWDLLAYIRDKNIFIRINTNGTLLSDDTLERLHCEFVLNLMVSMHEFNNQDYYEINKLGAKNIAGIDGLKSFENKFEKKVGQLKKIKDYPNITLDFLTILTPKNIMYLADIYAFVLHNFEIKNWHFFRLFSTNTTAGISRSMINLAIHKLFALNQKYKTHFKIVDAVPFCVTKNLEIASQVIEGELSKHHNVKTIITTDGNIQIMSAFDSNLGSIFDHDIGHVWQGEYVQKMLKNGFLPHECQDCKYREECRGGSRMDAHIYNGSYSAFDPLGDMGNKVVEGKFKKV